MVYYRLKAIVESPRTFVESKEFFGPDRRRREAESETTDRREKGYEYGSSKMRADIRADLRANLN